MPKKLLSSEGVFLIYKKLKEEVATSDESNKDKLKEILFKIFKVAYKLKTGNLPEGEERDKAIEEINEAVNGS